MTIIGQTGSGKTTAAMALLQQAMMKRIPVAILDTKGEKTLSSFPLHTELAKIKNDKDIIIYRPDAEELVDPAKLQEFLLLMYNRPRSGIVYVDELSSLNTGASVRPGVGLLSLLARGREHIVSNRIVHTTFIGSTQRPRNIPLQVYTESRSFMVFRLADKMDRKRVAQFTHPTIEQIPPEKFSFWHYFDDAEKPHLMKMNLKKGKAA